jgi:hypothetical protein
MTNQKPTAEAVRVAHELFMIQLGHAEGRILFQCRCCSDYSREDEQNHTKTCTFYKVATALAARDAEIERLKAGGCARDQRLTQFCAEAVRLQGENQKQRVLLVEALRLVKAEKQGVLSIDRPYFDQKVKEFLSNPAVVELLKPQSVWVPTVQCNGAMACVTIPNRVTTLKFDTEAECQTWCDKRTDALWVPVEHKELLKGST